MKRSCERCLWGDICKSNVPCTDFYDVVNDDDPESEELVRMIEDGRTTFREEWEQYSEEF